MHLTQAAVVGILGNSGGFCGVIQTQQTRLNNWFAICMRISIYSLWRHLSYSPFHWRHTCSKHILHRSTYVHIAKHGIAWPTSDSEKNPRLDGLLLPMVQLAILKMTHVHLCHFCLHQLDEKTTNSCSTPPPKEKHNYFSISLRAN
jgi:hypothetical protein